VFRDPSRRPRPPARTGGNMGEKRTAGTPAWETRLGGEQPPLMSRAQLARALNVTGTVVEMLEAHAGVRAAPVPPGWVYTLEDARAIERSYHEIDPNGLMQRRPTGRRGRPPMRKPAPTA
jgi:hypothetical protein